MKKEPWYQIAPAVKTLPFQILDLLTTDRHGLAADTPFGGVYFGTGAQMADIKGWNLSDHEK